MEFNPRHREISFRTKAKNMFILVRCKTLKNQSDLIELIPINSESYQPRINWDWKLVFELIWIEPIWIRLSRINLLSIFVKRVQNICRIASETDFWRCYQLWRKFPIGIQSVALQNLLLNESEKKFETCSTQNGLKSIRLNPILSIYIWIIPTSNWFKFEIRFRLIQARIN